MNKSTQTSEPVLAELLGKVYEEAPASHRLQIVEHLLKPLGILALAGVANGLFARLAWRDGWPSLKIPPESVSSIQSHHIVALAQRVQQVSVGTLEGLTQILTSSPVVAGSAATAMLISLLHARSKSKDVPTSEANE